MLTFYQAYNWGRLFALSALRLKLVSAAFSLVCFVCLKERTCETRKIIFYFTSKALFVLEINNFKFSDIQMS